MINLSGSGLNTVWPVLHGLGWISHKSQAMPSRRRVGQPTVEETVDYYNVTGPCREALIRNVRVRSASLAYASVDGLARSLVGLCFADILKRHPGQASFVRRSRWVASRCGSPARLPTHLGIG